MYGLLLYRTSCWKIQAIFTKNPVYLFTLPVEQVETEKWASSTFILKVPSHERIMRMLQHANIFAYHNEVC